MYIYHLHKTGINFSNCLVDITFKLKHITLCHIVTKNGNVSHYSSADKGMWHLVLFFIWGFLVQQEGLKYLLRLNNDRIIKFIIFFAQWSIVMIFVITCPIKVYQHNLIKIWHMAAKIGGVSHYSSAGHLVWFLDGGLFLLRQKTQIFAQIK